MRLLLFLWFASFAKGELIQYLPKLEKLRTDAALEENDNVARVGHVDVVRNVDEDFEPMEEIGVCHLAHPMPASFLTPDLERTMINSIGTWEGAAAIALAAEHMNTGDGSIVPEVSGLNKKCNIRFTMESFDAENVSKNDAVEEMIKLTDRTPVKERLPCAVVGPYVSRIAAATALLLGIRGYAQISPGAGTPELDLKAQYPLFGRTVPSSKTSAQLVIRYLYDTLGVKHLGVLHHPDTYGNGYALGLQIAAETYAPDMVVKTVEMIQRLDPKDLTVAPLDPRTKDDARQAIGFLKDTQFTYFVSLIYHDYHDIMMTEAYEQGIAGTGTHNWIFTESVGSWVVQRTFPKGSPLHLAHVGTPRFSAVGGIPGLSPRYDKLEAKFKEFKNEQDLAYLKTVLPKYTTHNDSIYDSILYSDAFLMTARHPSAFAYDAAIAVGLAACNITSQSDNNNYFDGSALYKAIIQNSFHGATGHVVFDPSTGSREIESMEFELMNHRLDDSRETEDEIGFKFVRAAHFQDNEWKELESLIFNDGTTNVQPDLPRIKLNENLLSRGLRAGGLVMCGIILFLALAFSVWTQANRKSRIVKSAQPVFLHIICAGVFILGTSIIPLSIDKGSATMEGCDVACMSFPWLLVIGFSVTFSALYAKTERIYRIIKNGIAFKRATVTVGDVYRPMFFVLGANFVVLSIWTALSPLEMQTYIEDVDIFGRTVETYSLCNWSDAVPYYAALGTINFVLLCHAIYVAWRAREISTELSESEYIFKAMTVILLVCFIGIPVIVIARENPSAFFFVSSSIIFVGSTSILLLIFCPKLLAFSADKKPARLRSPSSIPEKFRRSGSLNSFRSPSANFANSNTIRSSASAGGSPPTSNFVNEDANPTRSEDTDLNRSRESEETGVLILNDPRTKQEFQDEIERLNTKIQRLQAENTKLKLGTRSDVSDVVMESPFES